MTRGWSRHPNTQREADTLTEQHEETGWFFRRPLVDTIRWVAENGEPEDPRPDIDTLSLVRRFPHLAGVVTTDLSATGPHGPVQIRTYLDPSAEPTTSALVWIHGGGFFGGNLDMPESNWVARELAARGVPVIAVDYTKCLGAAHYPIPNDDVVAAWRYAMDHCQELVGVSADHLLLGGASAGGALAASTALRLRDAREPGANGLVLVYPVLHPNAIEPSASVDLASMGGQLSLNYAGSEDLFTDPHAFAGVGDGEDLPPTLVIVCERDEIRPSGEAYFRTLENDGVAVTIHVEADADHGHINSPGDAGAMRTISTIAGWCAQRTSI